MIIKRLLVPIPSIVQTKLREKNTRQPGPSIDLVVGQLSETGNRWTDLGPSVPDDTGLIQACGDMFEYSEPITALLVHKLLQGIHNRAMNHLVHCSVIVLYSLGI